MVLNVKVENTYSGPMDLLLYLVKRDEIDIHDIPVAYLTKEYLAEIDRLELVDVDAGGEFVSMASMLTEIKSRMLIPPAEVEENEDDADNYDPRQGLVKALLEYKRFKEVAAELEKMSMLFAERHGRCNPYIPEFQATISEEASELGALDLFAAFQKIARKMLNSSAPKEIINDEVATEIRIEQIKDIIIQRHRVSFTSLLSDSPTRDEMVGFFIALLELIRLKLVRAQQSIDFSEIYIVELSEAEDIVEQMCSAPVCLKPRVKNRVQKIADIFGRKTMVCCGILSSEIVVKALLFKLSFNSAERIVKKRYHKRSLSLNFLPAISRNNKLRKFGVEITNQESGINFILVDAPQLNGIAHEDKKISAQLKPKSRMNLPSFFLKQNFTVRNIAAASNNTRSFFLGIKPKLDVLGINCKPRVFFLNKDSRLLRYDRRSSNKPVGIIQKTTPVFMRRLEGDSTALIKESKLSELSSHLNFAGFMPLKLTRQYVGKISQIGSFSLFPGMKRSETSNSKTGNIISGFLTFPVSEKNNKGFSGKQKFEPGYGINHSLSIKTKIKTEPTSLRGICTPIVNRFTVKSIQSASKPFFF